MRMLVDQVADLPDVALGDEPPSVEQDDRAGDGLDLVEDVAGDQHGAAVAAPGDDRVDQLAAGDGVGAGQRLVEEEHEGVVQDRLGQLDPLAHPLGIAADGPAGGLGHVHALERPLGGLGRAAPAQAGEQGAVHQERPAGHPLEEGVLLGTEADVAVQARGVPGPVAQHTHLALAGPQLAGGQLQQRALARAVGPQQPGHARRQAERQVVQADHLAVPLRHGTELDDRPARSRFIAHGGACLGCRKTLADPAPSAGPERSTKDSRPAAEKGHAAGNEGSWNLGRRPRIPIAIGESWRLHCRGMPGTPNGRLAHSPTTGPAPDQTVPVPFVGGSSCSRSGQPDPCGVGPTDRRQEPAPTTDRPGAGRPTDRRQEPAPTTDRTGSVLL